MLFKLCWSSKYIDSLFCFSICASQLEGPMKWMLASANFLVFQKSVVGPVIILSTCKYDCTTDLTKWRRVAFSSGLVGWCISQAVPINTPKLFVKCGRHHFFPLNLYAATAAHAILAVPIIKLDECTPWCGNLLFLLSQKPLNRVWWVRTSTITFHTM